MWQQLTNTEPFYILVSFKNSNKDNITIFITDFFTIWSLVCSEETFLIILKESNFGLEIDEKELLEHGEKMLHEPENLKNVQFSQDESDLSITMCRFYGYPLYLKIKLKKGSNELFFQKVTQPLLKTVQDLKVSEQELRSLLKAKDEEIAEYKFLGGKIRYTASPEFKEDEHMKKHATFTENFTTAGVSQELLERTVDVPLEIYSHKSENEVCDIKKELKTELPSQMTENTEDLITTHENIKIEAVKPYIPRRKQKKLNI